MSAPPPVFNLGESPAHLGLGATVVPQPRFDDPQRWYPAYEARTRLDGREGRLVSLHTFDRPWTSWEMHPHGDELVVCTAGELTLHQEIDGAVRSVTLRSGDAVINPPGVWHTADCSAPATALFITAGVGTEVRPR